MQIRCDTLIPPDAVFGLLYGEFKHEYPKVDRLPVLQIPEEIRAAEPQLRYAPEYKLSSGAFSLLIGPRSIGLSHFGEYQGWNVFSSKIFDVFQKLEGLEFVGKVKRFGLRYINTFDFEILPKLALKIDLRNAPLDAKAVDFTASLSSGEFAQTLKITNNTELQVSRRKFKGSLIDIDTFVHGQWPLSFRTIEEWVHTAHQKEKELFFGLMTDEYISSLSPDFGDEE